MLAVGPCFAEFAARVDVLEEAGLVYLESAGTVFGVKGVMMAGAIDTVGLGRHGDGMKISPFRAMRAKPADQ